MLGPIRPFLAQLIAGPFFALSLAACGASPPAQESPTKVVCEGTWQNAPWEALSDTTFLRGPFLQSVMGDEATIVWRDAPGGPSGCVQWALADQAEQTTCVEADVNGQYEARLQALPRDTMVRYRASVGDRSTSELRFKTAPADSRPVRMAVIADGHRNEETLGTIAAEALAEGIDGIVSVGDQVDQPQDEQFDQYFAGLRPLIHRVPLWPVIGNHEAYSEKYFEAIVVPGAGESPVELYYGVRFGDVWLASLDLVELQLTAALGKDLPEATWLRSALASPEAQGARWRLLFIHQPPYSIGWGSCDGYHGEEALRKLLIPLAAEYQVAAIFSGHMHGYEHGSAQGIHLFVGGGAGGGLDQSCETPEGFPSPWTAEYSHHWLRLDASCDGLTVEAKRLDGTVIETTTIGGAAES